MSHSIDFYYLYYSSMYDSISSNQSPNVRTIIQLLFTVINTKSKTIHEEKMSGINQIRLSHLFLWNKANPKNVNHKTFLDNFSF